jgi:hypothetical protein
MAVGWSPEGLYSDFKVNTDIPSLYQFAHNCPNPLVALRLCLAQAQGMLMKKRRIRISRSAEILTKLRQEKRRKIAEEKARTLQLNKGLLYQEMLARDSDPERYDQECFD